MTQGSCHALAKVANAPRLASRYSAAFELRDNLIGDALVKAGPGFRISRIHDRRPFDGRAGLRGVEDANGEADQRAGHGLAPWLLTPSRVAIRAAINDRVSPS